ncbi:MAG: sigma-70 family RNA polymerase sigma factor [Lachnospiraceae bacterium]|jgi:RNA polymerase sigma factor (sigma-70 family)|nr:sigma-70 family RNA polymerase sigma factor [Lachnospiraceae bacterium]
MKKDSIEDLINRARACDGEAFVELMERHKQSMYKIAKAYLKQEEDVADAMSETILDCFEHLENLKEAQYFGTWLVRILINNCKNMLKKRQRFDCTDGIEDTLQSVSMEEEGTRAFLDYLQPLEEEDRILMILFYVWGFRVREIAELLHMKEATVKSRMQRGRGKIKKTFFPLVV